MKSYDNCPLKRAIQGKHCWILEPYHETILGLSSPEIVYDYISVLPEHKNLILVNYEPNDDSINTNSLVGMFDILLHKNMIPTFIDADFCDTILNSGDDLIYIYNKCKKFHRDITISFTFSVRKVGLKPTLKWLHNNFPEIWFGLTKTPFYKSIWKYRQFAYTYGDCVHYRDSGGQMLTGVIKLKKQ